MTGKDLIIASKDVTQLHILKGQLLKMMMAEAGVPLTAASNCILECMVRSTAYRLIEMYLPLMMQTPQVWDDVVLELSKVIAQVRRIYITELHMDIVHV